MSGARLELALRAVTLRGIGSYLFGQRLDIRPLTILCGENGSGKSSWFKVWNLLKRSQDHIDFPFNFDSATPGSQSDPSNFWPDYTNAYLKNFPDLCSDSQADSRFGPPGTIGLHFEAVEDLWLDLGAAAGVPAPTNTGSLPQAFLGQGRCAKGSQYRLRLAHPIVTDPSDHYSPRPHDLVELRINDAYVLTFRKRHGEERYTFECSRAFLPDTDVDEYGTEKIAEYDVARHMAYPLQVNADSEFTRLLCRQAVLRVRQLVRCLLAGIFCISAIRKLEDRDTLSDAVVDRVATAEKVIQDRHVGVQGEWTWDLERAYAYNLMRQAPGRGMEPASWNFNPDQLLSGIGVWEAINRTRHSARVSPVKRIWEFAPPSCREDLAQAAERYEQIKSEEMVHLADREEWNRRRWAAEHDIVTAVVSLFNEILNRRDLYHEESWPHLEGDADALVRRGPGNLPDPDSRRLNRRLIEAAFNEGASNLIGRVSCFRFEMYVSYWLMRLVQTRILLETEESASLGDDWTNDSEPPVGFLESSAPDNGPKYDTVRDRIGRSDTSDLRRFLHLCFGQPGTSPRPTPPGLLSAGFHQVAPMVVQSALMRRNEIVAIENPEVHLHPSLQLKIAEYLVEEARAGKVVVIETHSDLVVRRVLRAILAEDIPQGQVAIYFTSLKFEGTSSPYHYSSLDPIAVNERGQISNWPRGFMDDDVKESRRLLDNLYGGSPDEEASDGDEEAEG